MGECFHEELPWEHKAAFKHIMRTQNCVFKIMPHHFRHSPIKNLKDLILAISDEVHVLVRKDFNAQVRSRYIVWDLGENWDSEFSTTRHIHLDTVKYYQFAKELQNLVLELAEIKKTIPHAKLFFTEDVVNQQPYHRPVQITPEPPVLDFKPDKYFT